MNKFASLEYDTHPWSLNCLVLHSILGDCLGVVAGLGLSNFGGELHVHADPEDAGLRAEYLTRVDTVSAFIKRFHERIFVGDAFSEANMGTPTDSDWDDCYWYPDPTKDSILRDPSEIVQLASGHLALYELPDESITIVQPSIPGKDYHDFTLPGSAQPELTLELWHRLHP